MMTELYTQVSKLSGQNTQILQRQQDEWEQKFLARQKEQLDKLEKREQEVSKKEKQIAAKDAAELKQQLNKMQEEKVELEAQINQSNQVINDLSRKFAEQEETLQQLRLEVDTRPTTAEISEQILTERLIREKTKIEVAKKDELLELEREKVNQERMEKEQLQQQVEDMGNQLKRRPNTAQYRERVEREKTMIMQKLKEENEVEIENMDSTIKDLKAQIETLRLQQNERKTRLQKIDSKRLELIEENEKSSKPEEADILNQLLAVHEENQNSVASFQQNYRQMKRQKGGDKEVTNNSEAWKQSARFMLSKITNDTPDSNPEATEKVCKILHKSFPGSSWFVYIMEENNRWTWKINRGDYHHWKGKPGILSRDPPSGRPGSDMAIWGMICPDDNDEVGNSSVNVDATIETIIEDAQKCKSENSALNFIVNQLTSRQIRWSFVFVAPIGTFAQTRTCQDRFYFTDGSNYFIDIYLGL